MNKEQLMDKVNKLLALAGNNPSQKEANAAYAKAQELIAKHNLNMSEFAEDREEIVMMPATHSNNEGYRTHLAVILAANFRCRTIMCGNTVNFIGYKTDVEVLVKIYNHAYKVSHNAGLRLERQARKEGRSTRGVANSYWLGFCAGIKEVLDEQCRALMIVVPSEVDEELNQRASGKYRGRMRMKGYDADSYASGKREGRSHMRSHQIEG